MVGGFVEQVRFELQTENLKGNYYEWWWYWWRRMWSCEITRMSWIIMVNTIRLIRTRTRPVLTCLWASACNLMT